MKKHGGKHLGESIDFYVAMNMDGISELNDLAGGVTVTLALSGNGYGARTDHQ